MSLGALKQVGDTMSGDVVPMGGKKGGFGRVGWSNREVEAMGRISVVYDREEGFKSEGACQWQIIAHDIRASKGRDRCCIIMTNLVAQCLASLLVSAL